MRLGCVRGRGDGLRWDRSWRWVPAGDAGMTGARGRGTGVGRGFGCVQSVGRMCSVGWVNVFSFWPNVFTFWPNVFTLAGQVFSFGWGASPRFRRLRGGITRGRWLVGDGEWLGMRAGVGLPGSGSGPAPVMGDGGRDGNAINAGTVGVAGSAGKACGDGRGSEAQVERD